MAKPEAKKATKVTDSLGLDHINDLLGNPRKLWWLNFKTGLIRGFGGVLGAALVIVIIGLFVAWFGGLPWIGDFFKKIGEAIRAK